MIYDFRFMMYLDINHKSKIIYYPMTKEELKKRTKKFALRILKLSQALPKNSEGFAIRNQITRSGTSVGANYCASCRARSDAEFIAKLGTVVEEADETIFWLEIIIEGNFINKELVEPLLQEANELTAIFVSTLKTKKKNVNNL